MRNYSVEAKNAFSTLNEVSLIFPPSYLQTSFQLLKKTLRHFLWNFEYFLFYEFLMGPGRVINSEGIPGDDLIVGNWLIIGLSPLRHPANRKNYIFSSPYPPRKYKRIHVKEERENIFFLAHPRKYKYAIHKYNKCKIKQKIERRRKKKKKV